MENRNDILNELQAISPLLAGMQKVNVFTVPAGYFERLADGMLLLVNEEKNTLLSSIHKQSSSVPAAYFDTLADTILNKIKAQEAAETYPVLSSISKQNVYTVPQGYFETLSGAVTAKTNTPQVKVVTMHKRTAWMKYAAAAVFTGIIALSVYKFTATNVKIKMDAATTEGMAIAKENKFDEEFSKVTDEDIIKYLQVNGTDVDAAVVANVVDENELPSKEDYLTDDKALDKYLDNIDITDLNN
jgi:hypothetical protein